MSLGAAQAVALLAGATIASEAAGVGGILVSPQVDGEPS